MRSYFASVGSFTMDCGFYHVRRCLSQYSGSIQGSHFKKVKIYFATCVHIHFSTLKLTLKSVFVTNAGFLSFFFSGCLAHIISPPSFCYISNHVFKVSYELTYFVVVNKILTVYLILRVFFII